MDLRTPHNRLIRAPVLRPAAGIVFAAVMLFGPAILSFAQSLQPRVLRGFSLGGLFPTGAFNEHVKQDGLAVGFYLAIRAGNSPVFIGAELSGSDYGHAHRHVSLEGIPEVRLDVDTSNSIGQGLLFVRIQPAIGYVMTYVEGLAGLSYLFTETTISEHEYPYDEVGSDVNFHSLTVTAGAEAGLSIRLNKRRAQDPDRGWGGSFIDLKVRYMAGGRASYLKEGALVVEGNDVAYFPDRSATSFITVQAGFSWFF